MKKFLVFGCFFIALTCKAQVKGFSITAGVNHVFIKNVENNAQSTLLPIPASTGYSYVTVSATVKESFSEKTGFGMGARFDYPMTKRIFITSGLTFHYLQFKRTVRITNFPTSIEIPNVSSIVGRPFGSITAMPVQGDPAGNPVWPTPLLPLLSEKYGNSTALFLQAPLLAGARFLSDRFTVKTGAVFSFLLHSTEVKSRYNVADNSISEYKGSGKDSFNLFQAGATVQTGYLLGSRLGVDFSAQKFFTPVYKSGNQAGGKAKYNILSLGLSYLL